MSLLYRFSKLHVASRALPEIKFNYWRHVMRVAPLRERGAPFETGRTRKNRARAHISLLHHKHLLSRIRCVISTAWRAANDTPYFRFNLVLIAPHVATRGSLLLLAAVFAFKSRSRKNHGRSKQVLRSVLTCAEKSVFVSAPCARSKAA